MLARLRISIPDQPGTLGRVASTIGAAGADVHEIQVLASEHGRAVDDIWVRVGDSEHLDRVVGVLRSVRGIEVDGVRAPVSEISRIGEMEVISALLAGTGCADVEPHVDLQVVVDQAVASLDLTWAAVVEAEHIGLEASQPPMVLVSSAQGPPPGAAVHLPVRLAARDTESDGAVLVVPLTEAGLALVLTRREGPTFHTGEVLRLGELGRVIDGVLVKLATRLARLGHAPLDQPRRSTT